MLFFLYIIHIELVVVGNNDKHNIIRLACFLFVYSLVCFNLQLYIQREITQSLILPNIPRYYTLFNLKFAVQIHLQLIPIQSISRNSHFIETSCLGQVILKRDISPKKSVASPEGRTSMKLRDTTNTINSKCNMCFTQKTVIIISGILPLLTFIFIENPL